MATDFEIRLFEQELIEVGSLPEAARWSLERDNSVPLGVLVEMHSIREPKELYLAQLRWADYFKPVSLTFLNRTTRLDRDPAAWPVCRGFRPSSCDACVSWTKEGHALHPEWAASPTACFRTPESPLQFVLLTLQIEMDTTYSGRGHA